MSLLLAIAGLKVMPLEKDIGLTGSSSPTLAIAVLIGVGR